MKKMYQNPYNKKITGETRGEKIKSGHDWASMTKSPYWALHLSLYFFASVAIIILTLWLLGKILT